MCCYYCYHVLVIVSAVILYQYCTFSYYHPVSDTPAKSTYIRDLCDYNGWTNTSIRNYGLTEEELYRYKTDGFVVVRNAIPVQIIDTLNSKVPQHSLSSYLHFFERLILSLTNCHFIYDCLWSSIDEYRDLWYFTPLIEYYAAPLFANGTTIRLLTDLIIGIKSKPFSFATYHQDIQSFRMVDPHSKGVSIWIPLMDINASLEGGSIIMLNQSVTHFINVSNQYTQNKTAVLIDHFKKGDLLLFNKFTIHKSQPLSDKNMMRYAYSTRFVDGDHTYFKKTTQNKIMSKKYVCKHDLKNGELLHSPCYPQLWPNFIENEKKIIMNNQLEYPLNDVHFLLSVFEMFYQ